jgi:uncharacterized protein YdiU (UPF0061 family)
MPIEPRPARGRLLAVHEILAHMYHAMETEDHEYTEFLASLITYNEIMRHVPIQDPLRAYLVSQGFFRPIETNYQKIERRAGEKYKRRKVNRSFNPKVF